MFSGNIGGGIGPSLGNLSGINLGFRVPGASITLSAIERGLGTISIPSIPLGFTIDIQGIIEGLRSGTSVPEVLVPAEPLQLPPEISPEVTWDPPVAQETLEPTPLLESILTNVFELPQAILEEIFVPQPVSVFPSPGASGQLPPKQPATVSTGDDDMAVWDWGDTISGIVDVLQGQVGQQAPIPYASNIPSSAPLPANVTVNTATGKVTPCRRRRRRRLLTSSDLSDLASLKAIVGGGAAMNAAVVKAVRR